MHKRKQNKTIYLFSLKNIRNIPAFKYLKFFVDNDYFLNNRF